MKNLIAVLALVMVSQAHAQGDVQKVDNTAIPTAAAASNQTSPIYIINKNRVEGSQQASQGGAAAGAGAVAASEVQEQPVSVVQDSPLHANPADQMRKRRQETETVTEDGIVTALERARMDDEIKRRDKFNSAIAPVGNDQPAAPVAAAQPQPVQQPIIVVAAPEQKPEPKKIAPPQDEIQDDEIDVKDSKKDEKVDIKQEIRAALAENNAKQEDPQTYYVAALASFGQYNNVQNVSNSLGYGFSVGTVFPERIVVEASFLYGDYNINNNYSGSYLGGLYNPYTVDMRQYNVDVAAKYQILPGRFKPMIGAVLSYAHRMYTIQSYDFQNSDAVDVGALAGADLQVASNFALGVDFRYMTNLGYRQNNNQGSYTYQQTNSPESLNYYTLNLIGKVTF